MFPGLWSVGGLWVYCTEDLRRIQGEHKENILILYVVNKNELKLRDRVNGLNIKVLYKID